MSDMFGNSAPRTVPMRPLTKGMFSNISSLGLPDGSFVNLTGYDVRENGPRRCDPFTRFIPIPIPFWETDEVCDSIESFTGVDRSQITVAITNRGMYKLEYAEAPDYYTPIYWKRQYKVNTYTSGTGVLTLKVDNPVLDLVVAGDYVRLAGDTGIQKHEILSVSSNSVTIETGISPAPATDSSVYILKTFKVERPYIVDYTIFSRSDKAAMVLVDGSAKGLYYYDGTYLTYFTLHDQSDGATYTSARTVNHFGGRIYFGCVGEGANIFNNRVIWTEVLDLQEVNDISYQDLTSSPGQILKLCSLGSMIFCYFTDSLYFGRQTNLAGLPYSFTMIDTGGISAVGMRAMTPFLDGQIFVSKDDIYYVTSASGIEPIGSSVMRDTVQQASESALSRTQVVLDSPRNRLLFGFGTNDFYFDKVALFNYRVKAWSMMRVNSVCSMNVVNFVDELEYDDLADTVLYNSSGWADRIIATANSSIVSKQLTVVDVTGDIHVIAPGGQNHVYAGGNFPVECVIESGDFDFDMPDMDKTVQQLTIKLNSLREHPRTLPVSFTVEVSNDRGYGNWKQVGILTVPASKSEGSVNFRITGSTFRFRLTSVSQVENYEINENTMRVSIRGNEPSRSSTSSNP